MDREQDSEVICEGHIVEITHPEMDNAYAEGMIGKVIEIRDNDYWKYIIRFFGEDLILDSFIFEEFTVLDTTDPIVLERILLLSLGVSDDELAGE